MTTATRKKEDIRISKSGEQTNEIENYRQHIYNKSLNERDLVSIHLIKNKNSYHPKHLKFNKQPTLDTTT